jgi:hypothetical protein
MRGLEPRDLGDGMLVVHLFIDCRDAMGANRAERRQHRPAHPQ